MSLTIHLLDTSPLGKLPKNYEQASEFQGKLDDMPSETPSANIVAFAKAITNKWPLTADIDTDADEAPEIVWSPDTEPLLNALRNNEAHTITLGWTTGFEPPYQKEAAMLDMIETALEHNLTVLDHQLCHAYFPNGKASPREAGTYLKTMRAYIGNTEPEKVITVNACVRLIRNQLDPIMKEHGFEYFEGKFNYSIEWRKVFEGGGLSVSTSIIPRSGFFNKDGREIYVVMPYSYLFIDVFDNCAEKEFFGRPHSDLKVFEEKRYSSQTLFPLEIYSEEGYRRKYSYDKKIYINVETMEGREELTRVMRLFVPWVVQITSVEKLVHEITEGEAKSLLAKFKNEKEFLLQVSMTNPTLFEKYAKEYEIYIFDCIDKASWAIEDPSAAKEKKEEVKKRIVKIREIGQKYYKILNG